MSDGQLITFSRAARLIGVVRGELQKKVQQGDLHAFDGMVNIDDLLLAYPRAQLDDDVEYRRVSQIKEKAFGKRIYERAMPDVDTLAARVTELSKELAISQSQVRQFRHLLDRLHDKLKEIGERAEGDAQGALKGLTDWLGDEAMATQEPDFPNPLAVRDNLLRVGTQVTDVATAVGSGNVGSEAAFAPDGYRFQAMVGDPVGLQYLSRLSSLLFVLSRLEDKAAGVEQFTLAKFENRK